MSITRLRVRANDELVLDAGLCERVERGRRFEILIRPPKVTLFRQVLAYLRGKPDPPGRLPGSVMSGISLRAVQTMLGHSSIAVTERYAQLSPSFIEKEADLLSLDVQPGLGQLVALDGGAV